jgi:hypothetical protein
MSRLAARASRGLGAALQGSEGAPRGGGGNERMNAGKKTGMNAVGAAA